MPSRELCPFAAAVAAALVDHKGELCLAEGDYAAFVAQAQAQAKTLQGGEAEAIAVDVVAVCHRALRLVGEAADLGCGQLLVIVAALTSHGFAESAAKSLTGELGRVTGFSSGPRPVAPAAGLATTPLGIYHALSGAILAKKNRNEG